VFPLSSYNKVKDPETGQYGGLTSQKGFLAAPPLKQIIVPVE